MDKKQLGLKLSAVALAVLLASCGGGGSEGYYNSGSSNNSGSTGNGSDTGNGQGNTVISEKHKTNNYMYNISSIKGGF